MTRPVEHRIRLPEDVGSPARARQFVREVLSDTAHDELAADALLLTSELCENAVLHAGTGFELAVEVDGSHVTIGVTDHGSAAMELRRTVPPVPGERRATHGRGLQLVDALSVAWGSRHDENGHQVWFTLRAGGGADPRPVGAADEEVRSRSSWPDPATARWLLFLPPRTAAATPLRTLVTELLRRLCDVLGAAGGSVFLDTGDTAEELAHHGLEKGSAVTVSLPLTPPHTGRLHVHSDAPDAAELAELTAHRIALAVDLDRLHTSDNERSMWLTYLADATELFNNSLDVELTATIVPQVIVPRLGRWCAVHLLDAQDQLQLVALNHADETALAGLRSTLELSSLDQSHGTLRRLIDSGARTVRLGAPGHGTAAPLRVGRTTIGTLSVGRRADGPHTPEESMMISELARRAALAIQNAQRDAAHVATSRALQQVLLPRALPSDEGVRFAAVYLPASTGADVGGDFYDVLRLDDDRWLAAIGDVCGKGPRAAARTGLIRDVLRVLVRGGQPLTRAFQLLNEMMLEVNDPAQFATVALALITRSPGEPTTLELELVLAGHEKPALLRGDGSVSLVGEHGSAVGLVQEFAVHPTRHTLGPGDTLVLYTDGVTEHHRGRTYFGHEGLTETLAQETGQPADKVLDALQNAVHHFAPHPHHDDIAILAVQVPGTTADLALLNGSR